jgi:hypothetical protein
MLTLLLCITLIIQLLPTLAIYIRSGLDLRTWTTTTWFWAFAGFFLFLCGVRFGPDIIEGFKDQRVRDARGRTKQKSGHPPSTRQLSDDEERKLYQRMSEARKRQIV